jgi:hypothetical protein
LTENLISKYQRAYGVTVSKENRSAYASAVFYEKFWVTGNTITVLKWNISFAERKKLQISRISCVFDRNKTEVSSQENGYSFEHNLVAPLCRDKEMSKQMQLWDTFVVQELDNVYTKLWDSRGLD